MANEVTKRTGRQPSARDMTEPTVEAIVEKQTFTPKDY